VRGQGINGQVVVTSLKNRFEMRKDERGRVSYRDPAAGGADEPEWMRRWNEDQIGALTAANGGRPDTTYLKDDDVH
jgi:hypothetical protein